MVPSYLLSLAELHAAAPGVLDVVFGSDGGFEGAPCWTPSGWEIHPMLTDPHYAPATPTDIPHLWLPGHGWAFRTFTELSLDLRQPSVAARLAGLCCRAANPSRMLDSWQRAADLAARASWGEWNPEYAPALASLFLSLAPRIAALRKP